MLKLILIITMLLSLPVFSQEKEKDIDEGVTSKFEVIGKGTDIQIEDKTFTVFKIKNRDNYLQPKYYCNDGITPYIEPIKTTDILNLTSATALSIYAYDIYKNGTNDKQMHFATGYVLGATTTGLLQLVLPKDMRNRKLISFLGGVGISFLAGVGKEVKDSDGSGNVEFLDALSTAGGGAIGSFQISLTDVKRIFGSSKKKKRLFEEKELTLEELEELNIAK